MTPCHDTSRPIVMDTTQRRHVPPTIAPQEEGLATHRTIVVRGKFSPFTTFSTSPLVFMYRNHELAFAPSELTSKKWGTEAARLMLAMADT